MKRTFDNEIKKARWITAPSDIAAPVISRRFTSDNTKECNIAISALGFFMLYVNGVRVGDEYFMPSNSMFRKQRRVLYTVPDEFTYRCYYSVYDITKYLQDGDNFIEISLGDGWYRQTDRESGGAMEFGDALGTIFAVCISDSEGEHVIYSDGTEQCRSSATVYSQLFFGEVFDARIDRDKKYAYSNVSIIDIPETLLTKDDCVPDREIRRIKPKPVHSDGNTVIYDAGENITGFAVITACPGEGEEIRIRYSEEMKDGALDFESTGAPYLNPKGKPQIMQDFFVGDGALHEFAPKYVWHAFRYFEVQGKIDSVYVAVIHSDVAVTSEFECSCPELNWLFDAYIRTQLDNMHCGVPLDCPHRERLAYTGDGQLCAPAAMLMLDSKDFYRKWIRDIFDSQDKVTGHVNHTAPFANGGGGPGGWGCAAITVPYNYYKQFGDKTPLEENYDRMKKWVDYLVSRSENGVIVREEKTGWCLGDWANLEKTVIPEPFVNTCLFMRSLMFMNEIAQVLGKTEDIREYEHLYNAAKEGIYAQYYNKQTSSFADGIQGADVFAVCAGIGNEKTFENVIDKYDQMDHFDTGILGTPLLIQFLFDNGRGDIAVKLISSHKPGGFGYMIDNGATTIWEWWNGDGSHNHPMYGACTRSLFTSILGITQKDGSAGYRNAVIAPQIPQNLTYAKGSVTLPQGKVEVKWQKTGQKTEFEITLPKDFTCDFEYGGEMRELNNTKCYIVQ